MTCFTASFALSEGRHDAVDADMMSVASSVGMFSDIHTKGVSLFTTPLLSPSTTVRNRMLLSGFWSSRSFLSWWLVGAVCWALLNRLSVVNRRERLV